MTIDRKFWTRDGEYAQAGSEGDNAIVLTLSAHAHHVTSGEGGQIVTTLTFTRAGARGLYLSLSNVIGDRVEVVPVDPPKHLIGYFNRAAAPRGAPDPACHQPDGICRGWSCKRLRHCMVLIPTSPKVIPIEADRTAKIVPTSPAPQTNDIQAPSTQGNTDNG